MAERLNDSERTVKHHVSEILTKLDLVWRGQIAALLSGGWQRDEPW